MTHRLSRGQIDKIYETKVVPIHLLCCRSQEFPRAFVTGGQPGTGKSKLTKSALRSFLGEGCVLIDADILRKLHPDYTYLALANDKTVDDLTNGLAKRLVPRLFNGAVETRRNIILDQTSRGAKGVEDTVEKLRGAGYYIEMHVIAAPAAISKLRIYQRYEEQRAQQGHGRFTNETVHDGAYLGLSQTVAAVEDKCLVDKLRIYDYSQRLIYENTLEDGHWKNLPTAKQTFAAERERPLTLRESAMLVAGWEKLVQMVNAPGRNEPEEYRETIQRHHNEALSAHRALVAKGQATSKLDRRDVFVGDYADSMFAYIGKQVCEHYEVGMATQKALISAVEACSPHIIVMARYDAEQRRAARENAPSSEPEPTSAPQDAPENDDEPPSPAPPM